MTALEIKSRFPMLAQHSAVAIAETMNRYEAFKALVKKEEIAVQLTNAAALIKQEATT